MSLTPVFSLFLHLAAWLLLAPLLPGIVNRVKARASGRRGPPVLQLYYDLARLWRKGVVLSTLASPGFLLGPAVVWVAVLAATLFVPLGPAGAVVGFRGDALVLLYLLALARFATAWAALETGSAFEGMGTVREVSYAMLGEAALVAALLALGVHAGSLELGVMLAPPDGLATNPGTGLLAAGLFIILLAENCRVPFDDPNTHLELTMIHEAMVLDHSGPPLAVILHASAMKLLLFAVVLVQAVLPSAGALALAGGVLATVLGVGLVESAMARLAFRRVPLLLITAVLLCVFALLLAWRGDVA